MNDYEGWNETHRAPFLRSPWLPLGLSALACVLAAFSLFRQETAIDAGRTAELYAKRVDHELALMQRDSSKLEKKLTSTRRELRTLDPSLAPLASRVLRSVFTVETGTGLGTGFVAWVNEDGTFLLTADHVVDGAGRSVTITRKGGSWAGEVVGRDSKNDLALIRIEGKPQGAAPLWQRARRGHPKAGAQLLLVGSPFGLGGTVTTGVVSRVTRNAIQTDAAANPGNSGGPAVDREGRVVGILVAGGGQNINFAVRVERACVRLRRCG
jgi:S1-C subfamily serine protease